MTHFLVTFDTSNPNILTLNVEKKIHQHFIKISGKGVLFNIYFQEINREISVSFWKKFYYKSGVYL